jgi:hypothetical protein
LGKIIPRVPVLVSQRFSPEFTRKSGFSSRFGKIQFSPVFSGNSTGKHVDPDDNRFSHNLTSNPLDFHAFFELFQEILNFQE